MAGQAGLGELTERHLTVPGGTGVVAGSKVSALVAGADPIADMHLLRHVAMNRLFTGTRGPSTLRTFLRSFRFGQVR